MPENNKELRKVKMAELLTILVMIGGGWLIWEIIKGRAPQSISTGAEARTYAKYNADTLIVYERHSSLFDALQVEAAHEVSYSYTPDKYIYTGATVGGIHTGGVSKIEGGYSPHIGAKTGRFYLSYKYGKYNEYNDMRWSSKYINCLLLTQQDFEIAKSDSILKKFIPDNKGKEFLTRTLGNNLTNEQASSALLIMDLSKTEADYIRYWLGNNV